MLQAMHASNAHVLYQYETDVTNGLRRWLSTREILTFRNARARIRKFPSAGSDSCVTVGARCDR